MQQLANAVHSHSDESDEASLIEPIEHIGRRHCNQGHPSSREEGCRWLQWRLPMCCSPSYSERIRSLRGNSHCTPAAEFAGATRRHIQTRRRGVRRSATSSQHATAAPRREQRRAGHASSLPGRRFTATTAHGNQDVNVNAPRPGRRGERRAGHASSLPGRRCDVNSDKQATPPLSRARALRPRLRTGTRM